MKKLLLLLIPAMLLGLVGCKEKESEKVTLSLFHYKQEIVNQLDDIVLAFSQKYPNITIENDTIPNDAQAVLKTRLVAGNAPNIMMLQAYDTVYQYAEAGYLLDLSGENFISRIVDSALPSVTYNGKPYAIPMDLAGIGVIYNKDLFEEYGVSIPKTFDELKSVAATFKDNGVTPFSVSIKDNWPLGHFYSMAHTAVIGDELSSWIESMDAGTGTFKSDAMYDVFEVFDFYKENGGDKAMESDYNNQTSNFATGNYAMMIQGLWAYGTAKELNPALNAGFFPFPFTNDAGETKLYVDTDSTFAISATSSKEEIAAAKKFFDFLTSPEGTKLWVELCNLVPTVKGADVSSMDQPFNDMLSYAEKGEVMPWGFSQWKTEVFEESKKAMQEYYSGQKTADDVMEYLDELWKK